jgi:hypothetical protein
MASAFILAFIPVVGMISIIIGALVTLRKGAFEGALVVLAATLPYVLTYFVSGAESEGQMAILMLLVFMISNGLTWFFAVVLRKFGVWSFTLELAALLGVLLIGIIHMVFPDIQAWWGAQLTTYFAKTAEAVDKLKSTAVVNKEGQAQAVNAAKYLATGFVTVSILFNALLQLLFARWWQASIYNPGGLRKELHQIRLGHIAALVFAVEIILAYLGNDFALDSLPVLYAMFFVAGLSLMHYLVTLTKSPWVWLTVCYALVIWLFPLSVIIIAIIALFDTGFDFRKRFIEKR